MPRRKNPNGRLLIGRGCQLGNLEYNSGSHFCTRPAVAKIAGVRMCAHHKRLVDAIEADAKKKAAA